MAIEEGYDDKLIIIITPLNLLGRQNIKVLNKAGLPAVAADHSSINTKMIKVCRISKDFL